MHEQWQDLIPFYAAGTLSQQEAAALEGHLNTCARCRQTLDTWRLLGSAVRQQAESWSRGLPPLSPAVRHEIRREIPAEITATGAAFSVNGRLRAHPAQSAANRGVNRRSWGTTTLAATFIAALLLVSVLVYMATRTGPDEDSADEVAIVFTPPASGQPQPFGAPGQNNSDLGILPAAPEGTSTPLVMPTFSPQPAAGRGSSTATQAPPLASSVKCQARINPALEFQVVNLSAGPGEQYDLLNAFGPNDIVEVIGRSDNNWYRIQYMLYGTAWIGWVQANQIALEGSCSGLPISAAAGYMPESMPILPTPTSVFNSMMWNGFVFITTEQVGSIPAGTLVQITSAWYNGTEWMFDVVANDGVSYAQARESQLVLAPDVTPGAPTPTAVFGSLIGMSQAWAVTREAIGLFPAGMRVRIGSAWYDGREWRYQIVAEDGVTFAEARESQLMFAPDATPGAPTPRATPTAPMPLSVTATPIAATPTPAPTGTTQGSG